MEILTRKRKKVNDGFFVKRVLRLHETVFVKKNKNIQKNIQKNTKNLLTSFFNCGTLRISLKERRKTMNFMVLINSIIVISIILLVLVISELIMNSACCVAGNEVSSYGFSERFAFRA